MGYSGLRSSIAIEFDTRYNTEQGRLVIPGVVFFLSSITHHSNNGIG